MAEWFSIEVLDGEFSASAWAERYGDALIWMAAQDHAATDWNWHRHSWGVVLEIELADEFAWERFQSAAAVRSALEAVPSPAFGLMLYRGRGGSAGARQPRRPRPFAGAGAVALSLPEDAEEPARAPALALLI